MNPVRIGLLGLGTVGGGTVNVLTRNGEEIARRAGRAIEVTRASVRNLDKARICPTDGIVLSETPQDVVDASDVDVVVELIGGCDVALVSFIRTNAGVSRIRSLMISPTATSAMLNRNGTRQPHARKSSSGRLAKR